MGTCVGCANSTQDAQPDKDETRHEERIVEAEYRRFLPDHQAQQPALRQKTILPLGISLPVDPAVVRNRLPGPRNDRPNAVDGNESRRNRTMPWNVIPNAPAATRNSWPPPRRARRQGPDKPCRVSTVTGVKNDPRKFPRSPWARTILRTNEDRRTNRSIKRPGETETIETHQPARIDILAEVMHDGDDRCTQHD